MFDVAAMLIMMGIIMATVPVLLTNAPITAVVNITNTKARVSLPPERRAMLLPTDCASPVCKMAPPTIKSPTIINTIGEEKPLSASCVVKTPEAVSTMSAIIATISLRMRPQMKNTMVISSVIIVSTMKINKCS